MLLINKKEKAIYNSFKTMQKILKCVDKNCYNQNQRYVRVKKNGILTDFDVTDSRRLMRISFESELKEGFYTITNDKNGIILVKIKVSGNYPDIDRYLTRCSSRDYTKLNICDHRACDATMMQFFFIQQRYKINKHNESINTSFLKDIEAIAEIYGRYEMFVYHFKASEAMYMRNVENDILKWHYIVMPERNNVEVTCSYTL